MRNESETIGKFLSVPLLPLAQFLFNIVACCVALLMLRLVQATQLHPNCKYLIYMWSLGYLSLFLTHARISLLNIQMEAPPLHKVEPPERSIFIDLSVSSQVICALLEIAIASERLTSAIRPAKYYQSGKCRCVLYPITLLVLCIAALQGYITEVSNHFLAAVVILCIDLCTIAVNSKSVKYCQDRFETMQGKATLNARYQVRKAYEVASSMQRSYLVCFFSKNCFNAVVILTCVDADEFDYCIPLLIPMRYQYIEAIYTAGLSGTSCFLLCWLMTNHPRLKRKLLVVRSMFWYAFFTILEWEFKKKQLSTSITTDRHRQRSTSMH